MEEIYKNAERIKTEILFDEKFKGLNSIHRLMIAEVSCHAYIEGAKKYRELLIEKHKERLGLI